MLEENVSLQQHALELKDLNVTVGNRRVRGSTNANSNRLAVSPSNVVDNHAGRLLVGLIAVIADVDVNNLARLGDNHVDQLDVAAPAFDRECIQLTRLYLRLADADVAGPVVNIHPILIAQLTSSDVAFIDGSTIDIAELKDVVVSRMIPV